MQPQPDEVASDPIPARAGQGRTVLVGSVLVLVVLLVAVVAVALTDDGVDVEVPAGAAVLDGTEGTQDPAFGLTDAVAVLPDATLEGFGDEPDVAVADLLAGPPLVVNFWATWCAPCVAEMPDLQRLHEIGGDAIRVVGINTQDAALNAEPFAEELGITYDLVADRDGGYFQATGGFGMPTTLFVHPDGTVAYRHTGVLTLDQATSLIDDHLDVELAVTS